MSELPKRCPFCGCTEINIFSPHDKNHSYAECFDCCARSDWQPTPEKAIERWNTRMEHKE